MPRSWTPLSIPREYRSHTDRIKDCIIIERSEETNIICLKHCALHAIIWYWKLLSFTFISPASNLLTHRSHRGNFFLKLFPSLFNRFYLTFKLLPADERCFRYFELVFFSLKWIIGLARVWRGDVKERLNLMPENLLARYRERRENIAFLHRGELENLRSSPRLFGMSISHLLLHPYVCVYVT